MKPMISIKNLSFAYAGQRGSRREEIARHGETARRLEHAEREQGLIFDGFSLEIEKGSCVGIKGASGSGKTTLLRLIAGLEEPLGGYLAIDGVDMKGVPAYKRKVGFIFQSLVLFPHLTVKQNILFAIKHLSSSEKQQRLSELSELFEIEALLARYPHELSQGQAQRVAIARSLAPRPSLLLFDEPFSALDKDLRIKMRSEIKDLIHKLNMTCMIVSHDMDDLETICDRVITLR